MEIDGWCSGAVCVGGSQLGLRYVTLKYIDQMYLSILWAVGVPRLCALKWKQFNL